jgi:xanthine dehydrogenase accessory factor
MISFERLAQITTQNGAAALCTITETSGSTPRKAGAKMLVLHDGSEHGRIEGTIGGGAFEHKIRLEALNVIASGQTRQIKVSLTHELAMCCGGQMTVFIEPLRAKAPCIILGAGHIGEVLCRLAAQAGFWIVVADPRPELLVPERLACANQLVANYTGYDLDKMPFGPDAFVVVATHDHQKDQLLVEDIMTRPFCYAALVGSKRKAALTIERCLNKGVAKEQIARLKCPAGIDIRAQTPEEIAFSIVAEMILHRRADA